jgi:hypothetical protein
MGEAVEPWTSRIAWHHVDEGSGVRTILQWKKLLLLLLLLFCETLLVVDAGTCHDGG